MGGAVANGLRARVMLTPDCFIPTAQVRHPLSCWKEQKRVAQEAKSKAEEGEIVEPVRLNLSETVRTKRKRYAAAVLKVCSPAIGADGRFPGWPHPPMKAVRPARRMARELRALLSDNACGVLEWVGMLYERPTRARLAMCT